MLINTFKVQKRSVSRHVFLQQLSDLNGQQLFSADTSTKTLLLKIGKINGSVRMQLLWSNKLQG